jgi:hypothetical protein
MKAKPSPVSLSRSFKLNLTGIRLAVTTLLRLSNRGLETVAVPTATTQYHNNNSGNSGISLLLKLSRQTEQYCTLKKETNAGEESTTMSVFDFVTASLWVLLVHYLLTAATRAPAAPLAGRAAQGVVGRLSGWRFRHSLARVGATQCRCLGLNLSEREKSDDGNDGAKGLHGVLGDLDLRLGGEVGLWSSWRIPK